MCCTLTTFKGKIAALGNIQETTVLNHKKSKKRRLYKAKFLRNNKIGIKTLKI